MSQTMQISPKFFVKERDMYISWNEAFWREFFQNSIDAVSSKIDISVSQTGDTAWVTFKDNGTGFSREVAENIYFVLGETTKDGISTVGGRGRARIVTCFSHTQYELWSQDWYAIGHGSQYDITDSPFIKGCTVKVCVDATKNGYAVNMEEALYRYLGLAQLNCKVTVNGNIWNSWCYRNRHIRDLSFGKVYANKSGGKNSGYLIVRVLGTPMFTTWVGGQSQVVVEISPVESRRVLVSNRDSLTREANEELSRFIRELTIETDTVLRDRTLRRRYDIGNPLVTRLEPKGVYEDIPYHKIPDNYNFSAKNFNTSGFCHTDTNVSQFSGEEIDNLISGAIIICETTNPAVKRVFDSYLPQNWRTENQNTYPYKTYMKGRVKRDLLRIWTACCDAILSYWLEVVDLPIVHWIPGFIFSDNYVALHQNEGNYHSLLINPVDKQGKLIFSISKREDLCRLIALASHEIVHIGCTGHDERFANGLTDLDEVTRSKTSKILRKMTDVLKNA